MDNLKVSNVVLCLSLKSFSHRPDLMIRKAIEEKKKDLSIKTFHNFTVIHHKPLKYIIFSRSGHVNLIGTKNFSEIDQSLKHFGEFIGYTPTEYKIVNSTWTAKIESCRQPSIIDLHRVQRECIGGKYHTRCSLRPSIFPAGVLRFNNLPTAILFKNGTVNIVGAKGEKEARQSFRNVLSKIHFI